MQELLLKEMFLLRTAKKLNSFDQLLTHFFPKKENNTDNTYKSWGIFIMQTTTYSRSQKLIIEWE
jgi:hypothetical protein